MFSDRSDLEQAHDHYAGFREKMTEKTVTLGGKYFDRNARLVTPLHEAQGRDGILEVLKADMAGCADYRFKLIDRFLMEERHIAYWRWDARGTTPHGPLSISGMSEIMFDLKGKIISQIDYWDTGRATFPRPSWHARLRRLFGR